MNQAYAVVHFYKVLKCIHFVSTYKLQFLIFLRCDHLILVFCTSKLVSGQNICVLFIVIKLFNTVQFMILEHKCLTQYGSDAFRVRWDI